MPAFTGRLGVTYELLQSDQWAVTGRTVMFLPMSMKITAADRRNGQVWTLSAGLSAEPINLAPLGISAPGMTMIFLADQACDIRFNAASDTTFLSATRMFVAGANVSNLFVTPASNYDTTILIEACGGSNATVTTTLPLP